MKKEETYYILNSKSHDAAKVLYERYGKKLYNYAIRTWNINEDDAWEMVYKALNKTIATHSKYQFSTEEKFASFVFRIFINLIKDYKRAKIRQNAKMEIIYTDDMQEFGATNQDVDMEQTEQEPSAMLKHLKVELEQLEEWQQSLLLMKAQDIPYAVISKYVDKPENQLKVYYQRLKAKIMKNMEKHIPNHE